MPNIGNHRSVELVVPREAIVASFQVAFGSGVKRLRQPCSRTCPPFQGLVSASTRYM